MKCLPEDPGKKSFPVFLLFPQGSLIVHSFRTTEHQFSIACDSAIAQSAHSASVSCIEPAGDCGRAGGDRRFSRVNRREGFQECASARSGNSGVAASSKWSFLKSWTCAARFRSHCGTQSVDPYQRIISSDNDFADRSACSVRQKCAFLRECGFASVHLTA